MKLRRETRTLRSKAIASLRCGLTAFNSFNEDGRVTAVLLHLQHTCEMLLKAMLIQKRVSVFDKEISKAIGFDRCLGLAQAHCGITTAEAGVMRAVDAMRNSEQHWILVVDENLLYMHVRALVTVIDDVLERVFKEKLAVHLPVRVLPVSTTPMTDIALLIDREFTQIRDLLKPGRRAREDARGRIRTLLAMESHVVDAVAITERDIDRVERAIRRGEELAKVFPRLLTVQTSTTGGHGFEVKVHFTKKEGAPVRFISGDDPAEAAAVREVDLQKKYHLSAKELAEKVKLTPPKAKALRDHLKIDSDSDCVHVFEFGSQRHPRYSDNAFTKMRECMKRDSIDEIWAARKA
jgi:hypothetical protein